MIFSMGVREFVWVLCNQVNVFYDFRKSFTQHSDKVQLEENSKATAKKSVVTVHHHGLAINSAVPVGLKSMGASPHDFPSLGAKVPIALILPLPMHNITIIQSHQQHTKLKHNGISRYKATYSFLRLWWLPASKKDE